MWVHYSMLTATMIFYSQVGFTLVSCCLYEIFLTYEVFARLSYFTDPEKNRKVSHLCSSTPLTGQTDVPNVPILELDVHLGGLFPATNHFFEFLSLTPTIMELAPKLKFEKMANFGLYFQDCES